MNMLNGWLASMKVLGLALAVVTGSLSLITPASAETKLTLQSFNIHGGDQLDDVAKIIASLKTDIAGIQEVRAESDPCEADSCPPVGPSVAEALAKKLGFYVYEQKAENSALWAGAIISRYPIGKATKNDLGVEIDINGRKVHAFNLHLDDSPYQPYQVMKIEYGSAPFVEKASEAIEWAVKTRGEAIGLLKEDLKSAEQSEAVFLFGDFNEPSHLDWTDAAVAAKIQPIAVAYPTSREVYSLGFIDTFRTVFPDVVAKPGMTWTPTTEPDDASDHHDRIDFVYAKAKSLKVIEAGIVGEKQPQADIVFTPWPSDHRSSYARITF